MKYLFIIFFSLLFVSCDVHKEDEFVPVEKHGYDNYSIKEKKIFSDSTNSVHIKLAISKSSNMHNSYKEITLTKLNTGEKISINTNHIVDLEPGAYELNVALHPHRAVDDSKVHLSENSLFRNEFQVTKMFTIEENQTVKFNIYLH
ncbi:hypothetical protein KMW28_19515 [Flammeovirga yaeyamensis]|uniref:Lipoprotein n=1 Tax=Flammeovirga yaeyamensis TaxID=367791 RepID=A0AAX1N3B6_9BACT|nr:hypothetical protein [Flammeovirga yaeyamensis]MBB3700813.1 hypothetical protein [Flammeovirga yaeyamensis]NMF37832.1 hypothetical protein [Flammeovirga yaeyamensis]QWG01806.1 hypothetical protein KMW28_19515 [Flammeovirga yaeyamensis]